MVIPGECVVTQHKLLVTDIRFQVRVWQDRGSKITRTKWWKFKVDVFQVSKDRFIAEAPWNAGEDAYSMWNEMSTNIRKVVIY
jgi:hypothetical protein